MDDTTTTEDAMRAAGVQVDEPVIIDYWGFSDQHRWDLPGQERVSEDRKQYFLLERMNEGAKAKYQKATSRDVRVARTTGDAQLKMDPGADRHELIKACVRGWRFFREGKEIQWNERAVDNWLQVADPRIVEALEKECRNLNPWIAADISVEEIDRQIAELQEMREAAVKREQGEASSSSR